MKNKFVLIVFGILIITCCQKEISNQKNTVEIWVNGNQGLNGNAYEGEKISLYAEATDPDGDAIQYEWSAEDGEFEGDIYNEGIYWIAPSSVSYDGEPLRITLKTSDGKQDGDVISEIYINVNKRNVSLTTLGPVNITSSTVELGACVDIDGDVGLILGVCWNTVGSPTVGTLGDANDYAIPVHGTDCFSMTIGDFSSGTTYYVRSFAYLNGNYYYGNEETFTTPEPSSQICVWTAMSTFPCNTSRINIYIDDVYKGYINQYFSSGTPSCGDNGTLTVTVSPGSHKLFAKCNSGTSTWGPSNYTVSEGSCMKWRLK